MSTTSVSDWLTCGAEPASQSQWFSGSVVHVLIGWDKCGTAARLESKHNKHVDDLQQKV
jgi:hypothetical protein